MTEFEINITKQQFHIRKNQGQGIFIFSYHRCKHNNQNHTVILLFDKVLLDTRNGLGCFVHKGVESSH